MTKEHSSSTRNQNKKPPVSWRSVVARKLLNIRTGSNNYSADSETDDSEEESCASPMDSRLKNDKHAAPRVDGPDEGGVILRMRRRKSETFRAQYINTKAIRIYVGTWNVGGKIPPDELDLGDWIDTNDPVDLYVIGRIIWLGDLNYRINLPYDRTKELISKKDWCSLIEKDQLTKELKKGRVFDGWGEGTLSFAPTYKYEISSESYYGEDPKAGRRTPAWCDRILSYGSGMKLVSYGRSEVKLSDHRPVRASYTVEVEVFSARKLQRALTFTDAEVEEHQEMATVDIEFPTEKVLLYHR